MKLTLILATSALAKSIYDNGYSDYMLDLTSSSGMSCKGLLYGDRHVLTSMFCFIDLRKKSPIKITYHDLEMNETVTSSYYAIRSNIFSAKEWGQSIKPAKQWFDIRILKLNRKAIFPSKLRLADVGYEMSDSQLMQLNWIQIYKHQTPGQIYPVASGHCSHIGDFSQDLVFCGFEADNSGCIKSFGGVIIDTQSDVIIGIEPEFKCKMNLYYYQRIAKIKQDIQNIIDTH